MQDTAWHAEKHQGWQTREVRGLCAVRWAGVARAEGVLVEILNLQTVIQMVAGVLGNHNV